MQLGCDRGPGLVWWASVTSIILCCGNIWPLCYRYLTAAADALYQQLHLKLGLSLSVAAGHTWLVLLHIHHDHTGLGHNRRPCRVWTPFVTAVAAFNVQRTPWRQCNRMLLCLMMSPPHPITATAVRRVGTGRPASFLCCAAVHSHPGVDGCDKNRYCHL